MWGICPFWSSEGDSFVKSKTPTGPQIVTLPETNKSHLKIDGWNTSFFLGPGLFSGAFAVSLREGT